MKKLFVNTIYPAFMGECNVHGIGVPCTFVRLAGCNLRCYFKTKGILCDTPEALEMRSGKEMSVEELLYEVGCFGRNVVCLTGGEPLLQDVTELLTELSNCGYHVVVETNGSKSIAPYRHIRNVSFVVDLKTSSSGEGAKMIEDNYPLMNENDFLKFVVDTEEEYEAFRWWVMSHSNLKCNIAVGTFWGSEITYKRLMDKLHHTAWDKPIYLNMQTHKMAFLYDFYKNDKRFFELSVPKDV